MRILLAVSGGIDSMYLAENAGDLFPGCSFAVAHCNFRLRGAESDGDEAFVRDWCASHGLPLYVQAFDTAAFASLLGISLEMAARELRYRWFAQLCSDEGFDAVAVAHNADDDAETMLLNLLRGTGTRGLRGMAPSGPIPYGQGRGRLLRPMLGLERREIEEWMRAHGCAWREDATNTDTTIRRNLLRCKVFPLFEEINPAFRAALRRDREHLAQADDIAEEFYLRERPLVQDARGCIDVAELTARSHWRYLLFRLTSEPSDGTAGLDAGHLEQLIAALEAGDLSGTRKFGAWTLSRGFLFPAGSGILAGTGAPGEPSVRLEVIPRTEGFSPIPPAGTLYLDADLLGGDPVIRPWRQGDWMVPLGMEGRKKLSDLFTDLKFSAADKACARVIEHPEGGSRVAALLGRRIDGSMRVTEKTMRILVVGLK